MYSNLLKKSHNVRLSIISVLLLESIFFYNFTTPEFNKPINIVLGNEWSAGNLSYHLKSRPAWEGEIEISKLNNLKIFLCIEDICVGNR